MPMSFGNVIPNSNSITDGTLVNTTADFQRRTAVNQPPTWWIDPVGREIYSDNFEDTTVKWLNSTGGASTVARVATTAHYGSACLAISPGPAAAQDAIVTMQKRFLLAADQGFQRAANVPFISRSSRIIIGFWFKQNDANLELLSLRLKLDDGLRVRDFMIRFLRRFHGGNLSLLQFQNSAAAWIDAANPVTEIAIDDGANFDVWNFISMEVDYCNGTDAQGGYGFYRRVRLSDLFPVLPTAGSPAVACVQSVTTPIKQSLVEITAMNDTAAGTCTVNIDDFMFSDLSYSLNQ